MSIHVLFWSILGFTRVPGVFGLYPIDARAVHPWLEWMLAIHLTLMFFQLQSTGMIPSPKNGFWLVLGPWIPLRVVHVLTSFFCPGSLKIPCITCKGTPWSDLEAWKSQGYLSHMLVLDIASGIILSQPKRGSKIETIIFWRIWFCLKIVCPKSLMIYTCLDWFRP